MEDLPPDEQQRLFHQCEQIQGPDGMHPHTLKELTEVIADPLYHPSKVLENERGA